MAPPRRRPPDDVSLKWRSVGGCRYPDCDLPAPHARPPGRPGARRRPRPGRRRARRRRPKHRAKTKRARSPKRQPRSARLPKPRGRAAARPRPPLPAPAAPAVTSVISIGGYVFYNLTLRGSLRRVHGRGRRRARRLHAAPGHLGLGRDDRRRQRLREVSHRSSPRCYTSALPTTRPRYTITDTGDIAAMLDVAQRRWPDVATARNCSSCARPRPETRSPTMPTAGAGSAPATSAGRVARAPQLLDTDAAGRLGLALRLLLLDKSAYARGTVDVGRGRRALPVRRHAAGAALQRPRRRRTTSSSRRTSRSSVTCGWTPRRSTSPLGAQRELAAHSHHRVAIPDLLIAACAQQHGADVLHVDRHFEVLADVLAFTPIRAA